MGSHAVLALFAAISDHQAHQQVHTYITQKKKLKMHSNILALIVLAAHRQQSNGLSIKFQYDKIQMKFVSIYYSKMYQTNNKKFYNFLLHISEYL